MQHRIRALALDVLAKMEAYSIKRVPVMKGTQLVGIVSRSDCCVR
jgi:CBS domain-containing protein